MGFEVVRLAIRKFLKKRLYSSGVSKIEIERAANKCKINIFTARPGLIIGKKGSEVETIKKELALISAKEIFITINEVRKPELDAQCFAIGASYCFQKSHEEKCYFNA